MLKNSKNPLTTNPHTSLVWKDHTACHLLLQCPLSCCLQTTMYVISSSTSYVANFVAISSSTCYFAASSSSLLSSSWRSPPLSLLPFLLFLLVPWYIPTYHAMVHWLILGTCQSDQRSTRSDTQNCNPCLQIWICMEQNSCRLVSHRHLFFSTTTSPPLLLHCHLHFFSSLLPPSL